MGVCNFWAQAISQGKSAGTGAGPENYEQDLLFDGRDHDAVHIFTS